MKCECRLDIYGDELVRCPHCIKRDELLGKVVDGLNDFVMVEVHMSFCNGEDSESHRNGECMHNVSFIQRKANAAMDNAKALLAEAKSVLD